MHLCYRELLSMGNYNLNEKDETYFRNNRILTIYQFSNSNCLINQVIIFFILLTFKPEVFSYFNQSKPQKNIIPRMYYTRIFHHKPHKFFQPVDFLLIHKKHMIPQE